MNTDVETLANLEEQLLKDTATRNATYERAMRLQKEIEDACQEKLGIKAEVDLEESREWTMTRLRSLATYLGAPHIRKKEASKTKDPLEALLSQMERMGEKRPEGFKRAMQMARSVLREGFDATDHDNKVEIEEILTDCESREIVCKLYQEVLELEASARVAAEAEIMSHLETQDLSEAGERRVLDHKTRVANMAANHQERVRNQEALMIEMKGGSTAAELREKTEAAKEVLSKAESEHEAMGEEVVRLEEEAVQVEDRIEKLKARLVEFERILGRRGQNYTKEMQAKKNAFEKASRKLKMEFEAKLNIAQQDDPDSVPAAAGSDSREPGLQRADTSSAEGPGVATGGVAAAAL